MKQSLRSAKAAEAENKGHDTAQRKCRERQAISKLMMGVQDTNKVVLESALKVADAYDAEL